MNYHMMVHALNPEGTLVKMVSVETFPSLSECIAKLVEVVTNPIVIEAACILSTGKSA